MRWNPIVRSMPMRPEMLSKRPELRNCSNSSAAAVSPRAVANSLGAPAGSIPVTTAASIGESAAKTYKSATNSPGSPGGFVRDSILATISASVRRRLSSYRKTA